MEWRTIRHSHGNNNESESITLELWVKKFSKSDWNKSENRPVLEIYYYDYKNPRGYFLDRWKKKWYQPSRYKSCVLRTFYIQSHPELKIYSQDTLLQHNSQPSYKEFTLDYCKEFAINTFKNRLSSVYSQLNSREFIIEKMYKRH